MAAPTQNQALSALLFLYANVLEQPLGEHFLLYTRHARLSGAVQTASGK